MSRVRLQSISKSYGDFRALDGVDLAIEEGEFVTLLGASGSGKTTCLRTIAGFVTPDVGRVFIGDDDVTSVPAYRRNIGMVFQQYALFPHLTVAQNVAYGLKVRRVARAEIGQRTSEALALVHLSELAERFPKQLSGGQRQRVALARAVVVRPRILLLDEPMGALDLKLREELQVEIRRVQQALAITALSVTHDQNEALSMSDRVVVMADGRILQVDTPSNLYRRPCSVYVAKFVGRMNFLQGRVLDCDPSASRSTVVLDGPGGEHIECVGQQTHAFAPGEPCVVAFRPEDAHFGAEFPNRLPVTVEKVTYLGNAWLLTCAHRVHGQMVATVASSVAMPEAGANLVLGWAPAFCRILKPEQTAAAQSANAQVQNAAEQDAPASQQLRYQEADGSSGDAGLGEPVGQFGR